MKRTVVIGLAVCLAAAALAGCAPTPSQLVTEAVTHFQTGRVDRAKATLQRVLQIDASHPDALFYMGRAYHAEKFYEQAIYYYQCCLDADPGYRPARQHLRDAIRQSGASGERLRFIPEPSKY